MSDFEYWCETVKDVVGEASEILDYSEDGEMDGLFEHAKGLGLTAVSLQKAFRYSIQRSEGWTIGNINEINRAGNKAYGENVINPAECFT